MNEGPKIYTKTGDTGETSLFGGKRVKKSDPRIEAIGSVDEINASLGVCAAETSDPDVKKIVLKVQHKLFEIGAELANPEKVGDKNSHFQISEQDISEIEKFIDQYQDTLPNLNQFILPGGSRAAAYFHLARSITRRTERKVIDLSHANPNIIKYLNRLSDLFFVLARIENKNSKIPDQPWKKPQ